MKRGAADIILFIMRRITNEEISSNPDICCAALTSLDVSMLNTSKITKMGSMFYEMKKLETLDLSGFDTSNVTQMTSMFAGDDSLTSVNLSGFNTAKVTEMSYLFSRCTAITEIDLSCFETSSVKEMYRMFYNCTALKTVNLAKFTTPKVEKIEEMFCGDTALTTIIATGKWSTESITGTSAWNMFKDCTSLVGGNHTLYTTGILADSELAQVDTFETPGYFTDAAGSLTPPPITDVDHRCCI